MSLKATTRQPRMSSEDRRAVILDTACKLFAEKGFRGTTTRELAAAAGVTEPVLYEHFRTKGDLYSAIIENMARGGIEILSGLSARFHDSQNDRAFFYALAEAIIDWYAADEAFIRLLLYSNLEKHELKNLFHERSNECFFIVSGYIARRQAAGRFRAEMDPAVAARGFFGMVAHYAMTAVVFKVHPLAYEPKDAVRRMVDIFVSGMCAQDNSEKNNV